MSEQDAAGWLDEVLRSAGIDGNRLAMVHSGRRPVVERNNPWGDVEGIQESAVVLDRIAAPGRGRGSVVLVTDLEDDPIARVQAAVQLARAAVARGTDVLLVDADIRHVGLSRWLPDRDLDAEGLVDVLQYGASVAVARRPGPVDGIEILGVGSYRPDAITLFGPDDLRRLGAQLRQAASMVVVVCPAGTGDGRFHPLLELADAVAVSMHADPALGALLADFLRHLEARQVALAGMFVWAGPDDADRFVDDALLERSRALPPLREDSPFPGRGSREASGESEALEASGPAAPTPAAVTPARAEDSGPRSVRVYTERGNRRRSGSSSVLRVFMVVMVFGLLGFVAWWALTWRSVEPTRPRVRRPDPPTPVAAADRSGTAGQATSEDRGSAAGDEADGTADADQAAEADSAEPAADAASGGDAAPAPAGVETSRTVEDALSAPVERGDTGQAAPPPEPEPEPEPEPDPLEDGLRSRSGGWALHLSSFATVEEAEVDRRRLDREGYVTAVREATVDGRQWYRVLVGSFATRAAASAVREEAQEKFGVDWVGVVKK